MDICDLEHFETYGEYSVYSRQGYLQYCFPEYSSTAERLVRFHRKRPYRAL